MGSRVQGAEIARPPARYYRPRHPERTTLYRLLEDLYDEYERIHHERYEPR